jgi:hypothetical protein
MLADTVASAHISSRGCILSLCAWWMLAAVCQSRAVPYACNNILKGMRSAFVIHATLSLHVGRLITVLSYPILPCAVVYSTVLHCAVQF